jgi:hypothetical protein
MIGRVRWSNDGQDVEATLQNDLTWACAAVPSLIPSLNRLYGPDPNWSPADGIRGRAEVQALALAVRGRAEFPELVTEADREY